MALYNAAPFLATEGRPVNRKVGRFTSLSAKVVTGLMPRQDKKRTNSLSKERRSLGSGRNSSDFIRWFTDGERRYGTALWKPASVRLKAGEFHPDYGRRKVWRQGLEVAMKIKGYKGRKRVEWVNPVLSL